MKANHVAIIGGGVAGLAAGVRLASQGVRVSLFDARDALGGCCSTSLLNGYRFNNGALFVAVPRLLDHAFARLGIDRASTLPMHRLDTPQASALPDGTLVVLGDSNHVRIEGPQGEARTSTLLGEIERCVRRWHLLLQVFTDDLLTQPLSLPRLLAKTWRHLPKLRGSLADELRRSFSDPQARAAMAAVTLYTGLPAERTPVFQIVGLISMLEDGLHLPVNGMGAITDVLEATLRRLGGEIRTDAPVARIRIENGRVNGLSLASGEVVVADAVVSTATGMATFLQLLDPALVPSAMRRKAQRAPLSQRTLGIQLGLRNRLLPRAYSVNHVPLMEEQKAFLAPQPGGVRWFNYTVPTQVLPGFAPQGGSVVEMFAAVDEDLPLDAWTDEFKATVADASIAALGRHEPLDIATTRLVSPRDYAERWHLYQGAIYGLSPAARPNQQFPHKTPVNGLYLAGQTTYPGFGVATSMFSGIFAADAVLAR